MTSAAGVSGGSDSSGSDDGLRAGPDVVIPRAELSYRASRACGPGGQHVNTSSTRIELLWRIANTVALDDAQRERVVAKLTSRIDAEGNVRVVASEHRSQRQNREAAEARLADLVAAALIVPKKRRATKPSRAAKQARLDDKRKRSERKRDRRRGADE